MCSAGCWAGEYRTLLMVGWEIQSTAMDVSTRGRNTAVIFADGAGAAVVTASADDGPGTLAFDLRAGGTPAGLLWCAGSGSPYPPNVRHGPTDGQARPTPRQPAHEPEPGRRHRDADRIGDESASTRLEIRRGVPGQRRKVFPQVPSQTT